MRTMQQWLDDYGVSHQNATNKLIHWICVPLIFWSVLGLLSGIPSAGLKGLVSEPFQPYVHWGTVLVLVGLIFYIRLSTAMFLGVATFSAFCLYVIKVLAAQGGMPVWQIAGIIFVLAWIGQFIGHKIEGEKPSFFEDLQFLMIGPAWLIAFIYKSLGIKY
ncbi:DUF962 domain-containing protein [Cryomorphaceae bacterium]|nr:DUF962 domain-containing protein [Cryomorphaceae bacterium]